MKKTLARKRFTLMELLVAMGVFSVLLVIFMQFFSGMRLAWTNTEKRTDVHGNVRIAMDMLSALIGTVYYSSASTYSGQVGHFPFLADQTSSRPGKLYFASKTDYDLPGTNPIRFIGVQVPNATEAFGLTATSPFDVSTDPFYRLYVTVLSNDASTNNGDVYPRFSPEFLDDSNNEIAPSAALTALQTNLNGKLAAESSHRIELLKYVTDFQVRAYDEKGVAYSDAQLKCVPYAIEVRISILSEDDFKKWVALKEGGVTSGVEKTEGGKNPARKFRLERQTTFSRRIYIGSCYDKGKD